MTDWYVYIASNSANTLYTGMTDNLPDRVRQHKERTYTNAFTARYTFNRLVYFESWPSKRDAARREKQIKAWTRAKRMALIESINPEWRDLTVAYHEALRAE